MIIETREIGTDCPPLYVAELSANHVGSLDTALRLIKAAKQAGADAVKFQFYDPIRLAHKRGGIDYVLRSGPWSGRTLLDIYTEGRTPFEWIPDLFACAHDQNIIAFASVFDVDHVPLLAPYVPAWKIASFEMRDHALVQACAATGKPLIVSTGMASLDEINDTLDAAYEVSDMEVALLHCVSDYPCPIDRANLARMCDLMATFGGVIGYSDHTLGNDAAVAAVALGAKIIEKHLTLDGQGLDGAFSADQAEFAALVRRCRNAWAATRPVAQSEPYKELRTNAA